MENVTFQNFLKDIGLSQGVWVGFSDARGPSSISTSTISKNKDKSVYQRVFSVSLRKEKNTHEGHGAKQQ